jgi:ketosteroid isomerase-like protein
MEEAMASTASTEDEVRALLDGRSDAMWNKDIDRLLACYSPDIVYFDIVPPLRYVGTEALRGRFLNWFDGFEGPIGQDIHELSIVASGDVAATSMLIRASATPKNGPASERWVRTTSGCQGSDGRWVIVHEHVSLPVDLATGTVATGLVP